jgi:hypothetical protein
MMSLIPEFYMKIKEAAMVDSKDSVDFYWDPV